MAFFKPCVQTKKPFAFFSVHRGIPFLFTAIATNYTCSRTYTTVPSILGRWIRNMAPLFRRVCVYSLSRCAWLSNRFSSLRGGERKIEKEREAVAVGYRPASWTMEKYRSQHPPDYHYAANDTTNTTTSTTTTINIRETLASLSTTHRRFSL